MKITLFDTYAPTYPLPFPIVSSVSEHWKLGYLDIFDLTIIFMNTMESGIAYLNMRLSLYSG